MLTMEKELALATSLSEWKTENVFPIAKKMSDSLLEEDVIANTDSSDMVEKNV